MQGQNGRFGDEAPRAASVHGDGQVLFVGPTGRSGSGGDAVVTRLLGLLLVGVCLVLSSSPAWAAQPSSFQRARALVVGLDARNGYDADARIAVGADFDELRAQIVDRGLQVRSLTAFTQRDLAGIDLLVLQQPYALDQRFSAEERTAIRSFVYRGAALLVHGDVGGRSDGHLANLNQLLEPFGVRFGAAHGRSKENDRRNRGWVVDRFVRHPLTRDVSSFAVDYPRRLVEIRPPALDLTREGGNDDVLAVLDAYGSGRVVILGDASLWMDADAGSDAGLGLPGNTKLLANVLDHLLPQPLPAAGEPVEQLGLSVQLEGLRDTWLGLPSRASAVLRLLIPDAAGAGCFVELSARGAQPGALVLVLLGEPTQDGTLLNPQLLTSVAADAEGRTSFSVLVPASASGHTFGLRLVDPVTGQTSSVMRFEPTRR